jgi:hypothetical protein
MLANSSHVAWDKLDVGGPSIWSTRQSGISAVDRCFYPERGRLEEADHRKQCAPGDLLRVVSSAQSENHMLDDSGIVIVPPNHVCLVQSMEGCAMPDFQNPKAKALHLEARDLNEQAQRALTTIEQKDLRRRAEAKQGEADRMEQGTR